MIMTYLFLDVNKTEEDLKQSNKFIKIELRKGRRGLREWSCCENQFFFFYRRSHFKESFNSVLTGKGHKVRTP